MEIVRLINAKLSSEAKVLVKTPRESAAGRGAGREYYLMECRTGRRQYLSINEMRDLARKLGVLGEAKLGEEPGNSA